MKLYNTLTRKLEQFEPADKKKVTMYNCGPTVYWHMQIGNHRAYMFVDILRRSLEYHGYEVDQVMNITDVGHLTDDADEGEDKLEKAAQKEERDIWKISEYYIKSVNDDFEALNFLIPKKWTRATEHIQEMIDLIKEIEANGFTYETDEALYFDVIKYPDYTTLQGNQSLDEKITGARDEVNIDKKKNHPADFVLWMKCVGQHKNHIMRWESPWGIGFPGWHIECSAMGMKYLGDNIDIHTGGEDHIPIHHTNERAQNYGAKKKEVVRFWVHNMFLQVDGGKMGKSLHNAYTLSDIKKKGFDSMDLRYFFLGAHYRTKQNFTWESLTSAQTSRIKLIDLLKSLDVDTSKKLPKDKELLGQFRAILENDIMIPEALALTWKTIRSKDFDNETKLGTILDYDKVLGLNLQAHLDDRSSTKNETEIEKLIEAREQARKRGRWEEADKIRIQLEEKDIVVTDTKDGTAWRKKTKR